jgi:hypothetical protein
VHDEITTGGRGRGRRVVDRGHGGSRWGAGRPPSSTTAARQPKNTQKSTLLNFGVTSKANRQRYQDNNNDSDDEVDDDDDGDQGDDSIDTDKRRCRGAYKPKPESTFYKHLDDLKKQLLDNREELQEGRAWYPPTTAH